jgi:hypothetical protein
MRYLLSIILQHADHKQDGRHERRVLQHRPRCDEHLWHLLVSLRRLTNQIQDRNTPILDIDHLWLPSSPLARNTHNLFRSTIEHNNRQPLLAAQSSALRTPLQLLRIHAHIEFLLGNAHPSRRQALHRAPSPLTSTSPLPKTILCSWFGSWSGAQPENRICGVRCCR